jgi:Tfp pilus assembly protein PilV
VRRPAARGVSLIEALVALAVMSFGMLAVVGVQATLRLNADVAKQRSEAVRIGQEAIERWRAYAQIDADPAGVRRAYADIRESAATDVGGYTTNTTYSLARNVTDSPDGLMKTLRVTVSWADRNGVVQQIELNSHIARGEPALTAGVVNGSSYRQPQVRPLGRHVGIPPAAKDLGGGISALTMPGSGGAPSTTVWVFNNTTGFITGVCILGTPVQTPALSAADVAGCRSNTLAHLLSGFVRFSTAARQPTAADAENPLSTARNLDIRLTLADSRTPVCVDDAPATATAAAVQTAVAYYCLIPANETRAWAGYSTIVPLPFSDVADSAWAIPATGLAPGTAITHRLCRYTPATSDSQVVPNSQHPFQYRVEFTDTSRQRIPLPMPQLTQQNFLVILSGYNCPADGPADPLRGDFVNSNTLVHNPLP